jgi:hypothetical protein
MLSTNKQAAEAVNEAPILAAEIDKEAGGGIIMSSKAGDGIIISSKAGDRIIILMEAGDGIIISQWRLEMA